MRAPTLLELSAFGGKRHAIITKYESFVFVITENAMHMSGETDLVAKTFQNNRYPEKNA